MLLLVESRPQRLHTLLSGFLTFLPLLVADRLARRLLGFLRRSLLRLQLGGDLRLVLTRDAKARFGGLAGITAADA